MSNPRAQGNSLSQNEEGLLGLLKGKPQEKRLGSRSLSHSWECDRSHGRLSGVHAEEHLSSERSDVPVRVGTLSACGRGLLLFFILFASASHDMNCGQCIASAMQLCVQSRCTGNRLSCDRLGIYRSSDIIRLPCEWASSGPMNADRHAFH